jgi:hypothetical protein
VNDHAAPTLSAEIARSLAAFTTLVALPAEEGGDQLDDVLRIVTTMVPGARWASLSERNSHGVMRTRAATSDSARLTDELQYRLGEGPVVHALASHRPVIVKDLAADHRWPRFSELAVARTPVRATLSFPLRGLRVAETALNLYADHDFDAGQDFGALAALSTNTVLVGLAQRERATNLHRALMSNRRIGVAVGILMSQYHWTEEQAFTTLTQVSQGLNRKVADLAEEICLTGALPAAD